VYMNCLRRRLDLQNKRIIFNFTYSTNTCTCTLDNCEEWYIILYSALFQPKSGILSRPLDKEQGSYTDLDDKNNSKIRHPHVRPPSRPLMAILADHLLVPSRTRARVRPRYFSWRSSSRRNVSLYEGRLRFFYASKI
jgi:hypothetical protein